MNSDSTFYLCVQNKCGKKFVYDAITQELIINKIRVPYVISSFMVNGIWIDYDKSNFYCQEIKSAEKIKIAPSGKTNRTKKIELTVTQTATNLTAAMSLRIL